MCMYYSLDELQYNLNKCIYESSFLSRKKRERKKKNKDTVQKKETRTLRREYIVLYVEIYFSNKCQTNDNTVFRKQKFVF